MSAALSFTANVASVSGLQAQVSVDNTLYSSVNTGLVSAGLILSASEMLPCLTCPAGGSNCPIVFFVLLLVGRVSGAWPWSADDALC